MTKPLTFMEKMKVLDRGGILVSKTGRMYKFSSNEHLLCLPNDQGHWERIGVALDTFRMDDFTEQKELYYGITALEMLLKNEVLSIRCENWEDTARFCLDGNNKVKCMNDWADIALVFGLALLQSNWTVERKGE